MDGKALLAKALLVGALLAKVLFASVVWRWHSARCNVRLWLGKDGGNARFKKFFGDALNVVAVDEVYMAQFSNAKQVLNLFEKGSCLTLKTGLSLNINAQDHRSTFPVRSAS